MHEATRNRAEGTRTTAPENGDQPSDSVLRPRMMYRQSLQSLQGNEPWVIPLRREKSRQIPERAPRPSLFQRLKDRRFVQWLVAYIAMAWIGLQFTQILAEIWALPVSMQRGISLTLALGLLPALVVAWYHGEMGRQRICGSEVCIVGALLAGTGITVWHTCFA